MILTIKKKNHHITLKTPDALLKKFLSNRDVDKFCLNCFNNL